MSELLSNISIVCGFKYIYTSIRKKIKEICTQCNAGGMMYTQERQINI